MECGAWLFGRSRLKIQAVALGAHYESQRTRPLLSSLFASLSPPSENVLNVPSRNVLLTASPWKGEQARASGAHRGDTPADTLS